jgi:hypothetical protein
LSFRQNEDWQIGLGMHLFRQAERETLRVREVPAVNAVLLSTASNKRIARSVISLGGVKKLKPADALIDVGLPFSSPARGSHKRRIKRRNAASPRGLGPVQLRSVAAKVLCSVKGKENPVKVDGPPKDLKSHAASVCKIVRDWANANFERLERRDGGRIRERTGLYWELSRSISLALPVECWFDNGKFWTKPSLRKKEVLRRQGTNRREKRRSFVDSVVKDIPESVRRQYRKSQIRYAVVRVMARGHGLHSKWLMQELREISRLRSSRRERRSVVTYPRHMTVVDSVSSSGFIRDRRVRAVSVVTAQNVAKGHFISCYVSS